MVSGQHGALNYPIVQDNGSIEDHTAEVLCSWIAVITGTQGHFMLCFKTLYFIQITKPLDVFVFSEFEMLSDLEYSNIFRVVKQ